VSIEYMISILIRLCCCVARASLINKISKWRVFDLCSVLLIEMWVAARLHVPTRIAANGAWAPNEHSPPSDHRHFDAAQGSLLLGNWRDANDELENISPAGHAHPDVLAVRWAVYTRAGRPPRHGPLRWHADWSSYYDASSRAKAGAVPTEDERPGASAAHALLLPSAEPLRRPRRDLLEGFAALQP